MTKRHIEILKQLDETANGFLLEKKVIAKLGATHRGQRYEIVITRGQGGFFATVMLNGTSHRRSCKRASGAFLLLCSTLKEMNH